MDAIDGFSTDCGVRPSVFAPEPGQVGPPRDGGPSVVIA
jgi:hypothetical protein